MIKPVYVDAQNEHDDPYSNPYFASAALRLFELGLLELDFNFAFILVLLVLNGGTEGRLQNLGVAPGAVASLVLNSIVFSFQFLELVRQALKLTLLPVARQLCIDFVA
jgi:hypothetical protein